MPTADSADAIVADLAALPLTYTDWHEDKLTSRCADCGCWQGQRHAPDCIFERAQRYVTAHPLGELAGPALGSLEAEGS